MKNRVVAFLASVAFILLLTPSRADAQFGAYLSSGRILAMSRSGDGWMNVLACMVGATAYRDSVLVSVSPVSPWGQQFPVKVSQMNHIACAYAGYPSSSAIYFRFPVSSPARTTIWVHGREWYLANIYGHFGSRYFFIGSAGAQ